MQKRFRFIHPDQLKDIAPLCKDGNVLSTAKVWTVAQRQKGKTPWDNRIFALFETNGRERHAKVYRLGANGENILLANLKYIPALTWCNGHLERAD